MGDGLAAAVRTDLDSHDTNADATKTPSTSFLPYLLTHAQHKRYKKGHLRDIANTPEACGGRKGARSRMYLASDTTHYCQRDSDVLKAWSVLRTRVC